MDDMDLVARVCAGDRVAFRELYDRLGPTVYGTARRYLDSEMDAEDLTQDVFVGLPDALASFSGAGSLEGWVRRLTVRSSLMKLRGDGRRRTRESRAEIPLGNPSRPDLRLVVQTALEALDPALRTVFLLKVLEGYSHDEIAAQLAITNRASRIRMYRARTELRQLCGEGL